MESDLIKPVPANLVFTFIREEAVKHRGGKEKKDLPVIAVVNGAAEGGSAGGVFEVEVAVERTLSLFLFSLIFFTYVPQNSFLVHWLVHSNLYAQF
ncbi:MAG: hypothetical protein HGA97_07855 [Chlorobiaceae bacterium]|nr:hypothetical protein [Chlorobiaceae bacterium]